MNHIKEIAFRVLVIVAMLSLAFVALDMSAPVFRCESELTTMDVIECIKQPFSDVMDDKATETHEISKHGYNFFLNILLPTIIYLVSIGGFLYLLIEDFRLIKTFSKQNSLARFVWILWIFVLICLMLIPIAFGIKLFIKSFILAVLATAIFLIVISFLYSISSTLNRKRT